MRINHYRISTIVLDKYLAILGLLAVANHFSR